jgi:hypothetical protein
MALIHSGIPTSMIDFGQPRVGDTNYYKFSDSKFTQQARVTHYRDIVPHLPPKGIKPDYHHTATEYYEDDLGAVKKCNGSGEDPNCSDKWKTW